MLLTKGLHIVSCVPKVYRTMTFGVSRGAVFEEIRPGAGFKTGDFVEEKLGGLP